MAIPMVVQHTFKHGITTPGRTLRDLRSDASLFTVPSSRVRDIRFILHYCPQIASKRLKLITGIYVSPVAVQFIVVAERREYARS